MASRRSNVASSFLGYKLVIGRPASWRKIEIPTTSRLSDTTVRISVRPITGRLLYDIKQGSNYWGGGGREDPPPQRLQFPTQQSLPLSEKYALVTSGEGLSLAGGTALLVAQAYM